MTDGAIERLSRLTGPEISVVNLVAEGLENKRIATKLKISVYSVKKRLEIVYDKLNIEGPNVRVVLARYALLNNLSDSPNRKS